MHSQENIFPTFNDVINRKDNINRLFINLHKWPVKSDLIFPGPRRCVNEIKEYEWTLAKVDTAFSSSLMIYFSASMWHTWLSDCEIFSIF